MGFGDRQGDLGGIPGGPLQKRRSLISLLSYSLNVSPINEHEHEHEHEHDYSDHKFSPHFSRPPLPIPTPPHPHRILD